MIRDTTTRVSVINFIEFFLLFWKHNRSEFVVCSRTNSERRQRGKRLKTCCFPNGNVNGLMILIKREKRRKKRDSRGWEVWLTLYVFISASTSPSEHLISKKKMRRKTLPLTARFECAGLASMRKTFFTNFYCQRSEKQHQRTRNQTECGEHILVAIS